MRSRQDAIDYCLTLPGVYEDYPFDDFNWTVIRHKGNKKIFAWIFEREGHIWVNVKGKPEWNDFWRKAFNSVIPAYHLNKTHWNSIILDGTVPDDNIRDMIMESYELTKKQEEQQIMKFPALHKIYKASDKITGSDKKEIASVMDYWTWAHSDLMENAERGMFAEYLVAKAVGDNSSNRVNWDKYDLTSCEGIHIEVKTSSYLQTWGQDKLSVLRFGIGKTYGYDNANNSYESERKRQADVYVFCVLKETDQEKLNLLDIMQWDFYVLAAKVINENSYYADRDSISLIPLLKLGAVKCSYESIHDEVVKAIHE